jgi:hypothetical protein
VEVGFEVFVAAGIAGVEDGFGVIVLESCVILNPVGSPDAAMFDGEHAPRKKIAEMAINTQLEAFFISRYSKMTQ